jgi:hypothetical protein
MKAIRSARARVADLLFRTPTGMVILALTVGTDSGLGADVKDVVRAARGGHPSRRRSYGADTLVRGKAAPRRHRSRAPSGAAR